MKKEISTTIPMPKWELNLKGFGKGTFKSMTLKKSVLFILFCLMGFEALQAQELTAKQKRQLQQNLGNKPILNPLIIPTTTNADRVEIYENPGLTGRVAKYSGNTANPFSYPFSNKRSISLKVASGYVAYIKFNTEFQETSLFSGDHPNFGRDFIYDILSIVVKRSTSPTLSFSGISYEIHNNDCKKVLGNIKVRILERLSDGTYTPCPIINENGINVSVYKTTATVFSKTSFEGREVNGIRNFVFPFDGRTIPQISQPLQASRPGGIRLQCRTSQEAFQNGNIFVEVVPDLTLGHKSNDLADDYASNVKFRTPERDLIGLSSSTPMFFSSKVFLAKGNPNSNHGRASGVEYSIVKKVRIHFSQ
jgi:hypothetical protein